MAQLPAVGVHELYGSTEAGIVTNLRPVDQHRKPGSVGQPWYLTSVRVVDDSRPGGRARRDRASCSAARRT